jgi:hypothetical protein
MAEKDNGIPFPAESPSNYPKITLFFGKSKAPLLQRYVELAARVGGNVSVAGLITAAAEVCIDTLEKEAPTKRKFKLNGKTVIV